MSGDKIKINVLFDGRKFSLNIYPGHEEFVRRAVKRADDELKSFRLQYDVSDGADILRMMLLKTVAEKEIVEQEHEAERRQLERLSEELVKSASRIVESDEE